MNEIQTITKNVRLQQWSSIIQDCKASGLKVNDYCSEHNISRNSYYYWLRKIKEAAMERSGNIFAEVTQSYQTSFPADAEVTPVSICIGDTVIPVSYTHLDVYKRQIIMRMAVTVTPMIL